ncbi:hypothetical protein ACWC09_26505 [Streptomyces sp. NPDC001617]
MASTITAENIEDLYTHGGQLELPNGDTLTRDELVQYIGACDIDTDDNGCPLDDQWQILADVLGAPDPSNMTELVDVAVAASRIGQAEEGRDRAIRAALAAGHSVIAIAGQAGLSRARIYQIRDGRR